MPVVLDAGNFDLARSVSCGQAFRWRPIAGETAAFIGVARDKWDEARQCGPSLCLTCGEGDASFWRHYFALDRDYAPLEALLASDPIAAPCLESSRGIRILRQDPFETLISFILSANNNVARITGLVERVASTYGEPLNGGCFAFPTPERLAGASETELRSLGVGYRAPYVVQSACQTLDRGGASYLETLRSLPFAETERILRSFPGVGPKVAACVMLFGLGFDEAYPVDVWIDRASQALYPGLNAKAAARAAAERFGPWAGAAQQYLFHHFRGNARGGTPGVPPLDPA